MLCSVTHVLPPQRSLAAIDLMAHRLANQPAEISYLETMVYLPNSWTVLLFINLAVSGNTLIKIWIQIPAQSFLASLITGTLLNCSKIHLSHLKNGYKYNTYFISSVFKIIKLDIKSAWYSAWYKSVLNASCCNSQDRIGRLGCGNIQPLKSQINPTKGCILVKYNRCELGGFSQHFSEWWLRHSACSQSIYHLYCVFWGHHRK